jgi:hypothetical protein
MVSVKESTTEALRSTETQRKRVVAHFEKWQGLLPVKSRARCACHLKLDHYQGEGTVALPANNK